MPMNIEHVRQTQKFSTEHGWDRYPTDDVIDLLLSWIGRAETQLNLVVRECSFPHKEQIETIEELLDEIYGDDSRHE